MTLNVSLLSSTEICWPKLIKQNVFHWSRNGCLSHFQPSLPSHRVYNKNLFDNFSKLNFCYNYRHIFELNKILWMKHDFRVNGGLFAEMIKSRILFQNILFAMPATIYAKKCLSIKSRVFWKQHMFMLLAWFIFAPK